MTQALLLLLLHHDVTKDVQIQAARTPATQQ